jgi:hypothetical protein
VELNIKDIICGVSTFMFYRVRVTRRRTCQYGQQEEEFPKHLHTYSLLLSRNSFKEVPSLKLD